MVIAESDFGAHVHGLFESKRECLKARTAFVEKYAVAAGKVGRVEKTTRTVTIKDVPVTGNDELVTFSCLALQRHPRLVLPDLQASQW